MEVPRGLLGRGLCAFLLASPMAGSSPEVQTVRGGQPRASLETRPRLVLAIVVDQFRYDFLERFRELFAPGGFRRLMDGGAFFVNARFDYVPTVTAPGHAAVFTGSVPAHDGIIGNAWFDRELGRLRPAVSDTSAHLLTGGGVAADAGAPSPRALIGTTLGDQMRLATNQASKVVAISFKDRSAVLPGGRNPNGAYWFNPKTGAFVSSDYYLGALPAWVNRFNDALGPDRYFGSRWELALAPEAYRPSQAANLPVQTSQLGEEFPYVVTGGEQGPGEAFYRAFELTPFASEHLAAFAKAALEGESLGEDAAPDLLAISFSTPDFVGHAYGPDSREVADTFVRLDRTLADLFEEIDRRVGFDHTLVAVTGDHGVAPVPEYLASLGIDAGRIPPKAIPDAVSRALSSRFGGDKWVASFVNDQIYLDQKQLADRKVDPQEAERVAGEVALTVPGVAGYFTRSQILDGRMPAGPIARRVTNGFSRTRSGDVWIIAKPFTFVAEVEGGTTHGSAYGYDTHVPVILLGPGVRPGRYAQECSPSDIAPTLATLLGVEPPPQSVGRVLVEALAPR